MENTSSDTLLNSTNTPFIHELIADGAYGTNYHGVEHPSLPNYIEMVSGAIEDNGPLDCDCLPTGDTCDTLSCNFLSHNCGCPQSHANLVDELDDAGVTWRAYAESMGRACNLTSTSPYAAKHVPFLYFPSLTNETARCEDRVVDYIGNFAAEFTTDDGPRTFSYIVPNLTHDMHDPVLAGPNNLANGNGWLATEMPRILDSTAFTDKGLLIVVWDEDDLSGTIHADDPIPFILRSPLANQGGFTTDTHYDHDDLLALFADALGVARPGASANATPLTDFFPAN